MTQHQTHTTTEHNRYPDVFKTVKSICGSPKSILSFGCSSGEECFTLLEYFPTVEVILGVDINEEILQQARSKNQREEIRFATRPASGELFDLIFAMSVLCRWPETDNKEHNNIYSFDDFNAAIELLDSHLKDLGILTLYNTNYNFSETTVYSKYFPAPIQPLEAIQKEFVRKFDKQGMHFPYKQPIMYVKQQTQQ